MNSQKVFGKLREIFNGLGWFCSKIFSPLITPIFAVINYFVLESMAKEGLWRNLFLVLSIIYFLVTLVLACILVYRNIKEPKS